MTRRPGVVTPSRSRGGQTRIDAGRSAGGLGRGSTRHLGIGGDHGDGGAFGLTLGRSGDRYTGLLHIGRDHGRTNVHGSLVLHPDRDRHHRRGHYGYHVGHHGYHVGHYYHDYDPYYRYYPAYYPWQGYVYTSVYYQEPVVYRYYEPEPVYVEPVYDPSGGAVGTVQPPPVAGYDTAPYLPIEPSPEPLMQRGADAFAAGRYDEARSFFMQSVLADERDGYAKLLLALTHFAMREYDVASLALRRSLLTAEVLIREPLDVRTLYEDLGRFQAQLSDLAAHVAREPWADDSQLLLAYVHFSIGQAEEAAAILDRVTRRNPEDALAKQLLASVRDASRAVPQP